MKKKLILMPLLIISMVSICIAQKNFKDGYIITNDYDTIYGQIDYKGDYLMGSVCQFKPQNSETIIQYSPEEITAYRFTNGKYFVSKMVPVESKMQKVFLEYLLDGELSVYYLRQTNDHYFIEKEGKDIVELPYEEEYRFKDNAKYLYQSKKHIGLLQYYMEDAPEITAQIQHIERPGHANLVKVAENYHNIVCTDHKCINYQKTIPFMKLSIEATSGFMHYGPTEKNIREALGEGNELGNCYTGGLFAHINLTRANEKLYIKTGIQYFHFFQYSSDDNNTYCVPIHIEYIDPNGLVRPRFSYGYNIYSQKAYGPTTYQGIFDDNSTPGGISISMTAGANIRINEKLFVSLLANVEFGVNDKIGFIPHNRIGSSLMAGIYYDL